MQHSLAIFLLCALSVAMASQKAVGYHEHFGIPEAERIRIREAVSSRVVGGMASEVGENTYLAGLIISLTNTQTSVCGGTLLNNRKVLTAAQCWYDGYLQGSAITVVLGSTKLFSGGVRLNAYSIILHPLYDPQQIINDLAMLTIPTVSFNENIKPALLPVHEQGNSFLGATVKAVGFGVTSDRDQLTIAQEQHSVNVPVISNEECDSKYNSVIDGNMLCTSGASKWGHCNGDGGAPIIYDSYGDNLVIGVSSFHSVAGCQSGFPFGYMRVTAYLPWIQSLMR